MKRWWMLLACLACAIARPATPKIYAWLEDSSQTPLVHVQRGTRMTAYDPWGGLQPCDRVGLQQDAAATVAIATADGTRFVLDRTTRLVQLPCGRRPGITHDVLAFLQAILEKSNQRVPVAALTKGFRGGCQSDLDMALLSRGAQTPTMLSSDSVPLLLAWTGTAHPFSIQLDSPRGTPVVQVAAVDDNLYRADISLPPGRYRLHVHDSCQQKLDDDYVLVVTPADLPARPPELAGIPEPARTIYYADYLLGLGDGRWGLEALQRVSKLPASDPAAQAWIRRWTSRQ